jgi:type IV pilus assembly protein PilC
MKFLYQARTKEGDLKSGVIEASSKEVALSLLQKLGYYVTYLEEERPPIYARELKIFQRVSLKDLFVFSRQFSILLNSQVPVVESLMVLAAQTKNLELKEIILDLAKEVEAGAPLSKTLLKYPRVFSPLFVAMVKTGEVSGRLSQSFNYLADYLEREYNIRGKITGAMIYPALVFLVLLIILGTVIFSVLPSLEGILIERGVEIPFFTKVILSFSRFLRKKFLILIFLLGIFSFLIFYYSRTKEGKRIFDKISLKIPFFGEITKLSILSRFAGNLSILTSAGLTITEALEILQEIVGNEIYESVISKIKEGVKRGETISSISSLYPDLFPPLFTQMVAVGENTGNLANCLLLVSNFYQSEAERSIEKFLRVLEPLLIIILGGLVGGLMFSVLLPLYKTIGTY